MAVYGGAIAHATVFRGIGIRRRGPLGVHSRLLSVLRAGGSGKMVTLTELGRCVFLCASGAPA